VRPRRVEAFLRLQTLPGEQAQVDWGHFGKVIVGNATRPLMAFVMVLSYLRGAS
jgi:transposase